MIKVHFKNWTINLGGENAELLDFDDSKLIFQTEKWVKVVIKFIIDITQSCKWDT